jgi:uncharacterized protein (DUF2236 family)
MAIALSDMWAPPPGVPRVDFMQPSGEPALAAPDSVSWRVFKNPLALFVGGVAAVILELAEPRVRTGVWEHTTFRSDPIGRMRRTGYAAMVTVYGPRSAAERMIASVSRMHARVNGATPDGVDYRADDPELLTWVQATAAFGFLNAYHRFVRDLPQPERNRFYAEGGPASALYGASGAPVSEAACEALFARMTPKLERSQIVFEFLDIVKQAPIAPAPLGLVQRLLVRGAVEIVPRNIREVLGLDERFALPFGGEGAIRAMGAIADRFVLNGAPPAQACRRLGLSPDYLRH